MSDVKAIKITNPLFVGQLGPHIQSFVERIAPIGVTYETMYSYLAQIAQFGGENAELWLAQNEVDPLAFATWHVRQLPHVGKVCLDYTYNWSKKTEAMIPLLEEFKQFGIKHRAPLHEIDTRNKTLVELIRRYSDERGYEILEDGKLNRIMIRKKADG